MELSFTTLFMIQMCVQISDLKGQFLATSLRYIVVVACDWLAAGGEGGVSTAGNKAANRQTDKDKHDFRSVRHGSEET